MRAQHDDFIGGAGYFSDRVVARAPVGVRAIHDVELELDGLACCEETRDPTVVLIPQDDGWNRLRHIVCVVGKCANLPLVASRIVYPHECTAPLKKLVELHVDLA